MVNTLLVVNCGSSTVKLTAFEAPSLKRIVDQSIEGTGEPALKRALDSLPESLQKPIAVGHRVVHGGERFAAPVRLDTATLSYIESLSPLAPLHNPLCLQGIQTCLSRFGPDVPQVAVFDTAFYRNMPDRAKYYGIDRALAEQHQIQRYGFHGISHDFMQRLYHRSALRAHPAARLITLHLGNGCSATAIRAGVAIDTSMGFTPLEGLLMATRCGDLDPSTVSWLCERATMTPSQVIDLLNQRSGLLGVSGSSSSMKALLEQESTSPSAQLAIEMFCYRVQKYIGAYFVALGGADALLFSGGLAEHSPVIRERIISGLSCLSITLDPEANTLTTGLYPGDIRRISAPDSKREVYVVGADENRMIAEELIALKI